MLNLFDYLTPLDNERIENYISKYGIEDDYCGNETYLRYWAKCKKHLFHLFGGQLIYKFPFKRQKDKQILNNELCDLINSHPFTRAYCDAIAELNKTLNIKLDTKQIWALQDLASSDAIEDKVYSSIKYRIADDKSMLQISKGMKPIRALQKVINYFDMGQEIKDMFEDFRIKHSLILNEKEISGQMCLSIHPLDFMTMSDNASGWSSCMSWKNEGCFRIGTVEMMNSNNVICCYIESDKPYCFGGEDLDDEAWYWNNKKWRQLFYITKEIAVSGKAYPYHNDDFSKTILEKIKELTEKNLGRTYTFGIEEYQDMRHIGSLYRMSQNQYWIRAGRTKKHNIIFHTNAMYNDMFNDHESFNRKYWCYRNKVKKNTVIKYSGKAICLCCGKEINNEVDPDGYYDGDYNDRYTETRDLICWECIDERFCDCCKDSSGFKKIYHIGSHRYCSDCVEERIRKCPDCGEPFDAQKSPLLINNWVRLKDKTAFQQDFYYFDEIKPEDRVVVPYCTCGNCEGSNNFVKNKATAIVPKVDPNRTSFSWRNNLSYYLSDEIYAASSKYLFKNLEKIKIENE